MLLKPSDKFIKADCHFFVFGIGASVAIVFILKAYCSIFLIDFQYPVGRYGSLVCISTKIFKHRFWYTKWFFRIYILVFFAHFFHEHRGVYYANLKTTRYQ